MGSLPSRLILVFLYCALERHGPGAGSRTGGCWISRVSHSWSAKSKSCQGVGSGLLGGLALGDESPNNCISSSSSVNSSRFVARRVRDGMVYGGLTLTGAGGTLTVSMGTSAGTMSSGARADWHVQKPLGRGCRWAFLCLRMALVYIAGFGVVESELPDGGNQKTGLYPKKEMGSREQPK